MLVRASDLLVAGITAGPITSLAFDVASNASTVNENGFTIRMAHTAQTTMTSTFVSTGLQEVYTTGHYDPVVGWNTHTFSTPFMWNGTSNIIVETYYSNCGNSPSSCIGGTTCNGAFSGLTWDESAVVNQTTMSYVARATYYSDDESCNPLRHAFLKYIH